MWFELSLNLILALSILGILILFLRRLPEVLATEQKRQAGISELIEADKIEKPGFREILRRFGAAGVKKVWQFMLEAKDLKQGQVLATNFVQVHKPAEKVFNIGVLSTLKKAQRLLEENEFDQSERAFIEVIKKNPHEYAAYEGLVKIYSQQKNFNEVQQVLEYLVRHNPQNDSYLTQLGATLIRRRRFKEAIEAYRRALEINDLVPVRYVNTALCYDALGKFPEARDNFQKALDLDPANVQYLMLLVDLVLKHGDVAQAKKLLEKGSEMNSEDPQILEKIIELQADHTLKI